MAMTLQRKPEKAGPRLRQVLDELDRSLEREDPLPPSLIRRAQDLYVWHDIDAELLELLNDSATDELAAVRGGDHRLIVFGSLARSIQLEITARSTGFDVAGFVNPVDGQSILAEWDGGAQTAPSDADGAFSLVGLPNATVRFAVIEGDETRSCLTPWF